MNIVKIIEQCIALSSHRRPYTADAFRIHADTCSMPYHSSCTQVTIRTDSTALCSFLVSPSKSSGHHQDTRNSGQYSVSTVLYSCVVRISSVQLLLPYQYKTVRGTSPCESFSSRTLHVTTVSSDISVRVLTELSSVSKHRSSHLTGALLRTLHMPGNVFHHHLQRPLFL